MTSLDIKIGTSLIPGSYLLANNSFITGIVIEIEPKRYPQMYKIVLSNGNDVWKSAPEIRDFWDVVNFDDEP